MVELEQQLERGREQGREQEREQQVPEGLQQVAVVEEEEDVAASANRYMPEVEKPAHTVPESTR